MPTETLWIAMPGDIGDALLLSGILKLAHDRLAKRYNIIRSTTATEMLAGHPGIERIDYLPKGAPVLPIAWGGHEACDGNEPRTFQMLAKIFGLELPAPETLYLPMDGVSDALLASMIPWRTKNVAIAPDCTSPLKMMPRSKWHQVAKELSASGALVVQLGQVGAEKVKHAYSLAGVTTPKEAILLLKRMDLLITSDTFLMHAAHMTGTPAICVWGPTTAAAHGYPEHHKIIATCRDNPGQGFNNATSITPTDFFFPTETSCLDSINADDIANLALKAIISGQTTQGEARNNK